MEDGDLPAAVRFVSPVTVDGYPFAVGEEVAADDLPSGVLPGLVRCGYVVACDLTPADGDDTDPGDDGE